jgi:hypothetical protein
MEDKMERREMTDEVRKAMLGLNPVSLQSTVEFIPESYLIKKKDSNEYLVPEDFWPKFKIRPWTKLEANHIKKNISRFIDSKDDSEMREHIRKTVMGWENLIEAARGDPIEYIQEPTGGASKELFEVFPTALITDLLNKCMTISGIADMERSALR